MGGSSEGRQLAQETEEPRLGNCLFLGSQDSTKGGKRRRPWGIASGNGNWVSWVQAGWPKEPQDKMTGPRTQIAWGSHHRPKHPLVDSISFPYKESCVTNWQRNAARKASLASRLTHQGSITASTHPESYRADKTPAASRCLYQIPLQNVKAAFLLLKRCTPEGLVMAIRLFLKLFTGDLSFFQICVRF